MQNQADGEGRPMATGKPSSARDHGSDEKIEYDHPIGAGGASREAAGDVSYDDAAGGEAWNRTLGGNTSAGMARLLAVIAIFILVGASLFWLVAG